LSEFLPLNAPRVLLDKPEPAEPLAWYEVIAPRFPVVDVPAEEEPAEQVGADGARRAAFGSIESVAEGEVRRRLATEPEPALIRTMRVAASEDAARIVAEALEQARALLDESRARGYREGHDAGYAAGEREATRHLTQRADDERAAYREELAAFIGSVEGASRQAWTAMESEILGLVLDIARKVIKMEVEINREAAIAVVKNTLRRVSDATSLRIRVHADDLQTVRANREDLYTLVDSIRKVEIVEDRRVGQGGCIVETDSGTIDARIETQLDELRKLLDQGAPPPND
jgi:flagellar assembly protein FliH